MDDSDPLTLTKTRYAELSGCHRSTIDSHMREFGIEPLETSPIHVRELIAWLHTFLRSNRRLLLPTAANDPLNDSPNWRDRCYELRSKMMEVDLALKAGDAVPREAVHSLLGRWAVIIRGLGESLRKLHGPDAVALLNDALDDCAAIVESFSCEKQRNGEPH